LGLIQAVYFIEFLDISDTSLNSVRATLKARTKGPVKIIDVTKSSSKAEPEFMLCLPEVGVFIDAFGVRSRPGDFKWSHKPLDFSKTISNSRDNIQYNALFVGFKAPSLYVQYQSAILELKPNADKLCFKDDSDASSTISSDEGLLQLISPKLLGLFKLNIARTDLIHFW
jgi:CNH domain